MSSYTTWEYNTERVMLSRVYPDVTTLVQFHGKQGWELVTTINDGVWVTLIFKRPKL